MAEQARRDEGAPHARNEFGAFGGVFTPCILTILGVILFMRANFVTGQAGILGTILILILAKSITLATSLSTNAIGTNMQVRGGGAYYLISRVLGPEYGGAIGIVLFLAQAVSVPFYVLGFTEAITQTFTALQPHYAAIAFTTAGILFAITYVGAGWAIKVQYLIMAVLAVSIVVFLGGAALRFSPATFAANWTSQYTPVGPDTAPNTHYSFWIVFAIYFPAVTGIMAGINMSGDLKEPARSIPRGTLGAIGVGFVVYLAQILICGGAFDRQTLVERPYLVLTENALLGAGILVAAGMFAATLSSALGSYMGAPRVLQAVSRDRILLFLRPFARGTAKGDEPRRALIVTGVITALVLLWASAAGQGGALNMVAGTITQFFLYTYGMLNIAAFIEAAGQNPSFRPRFRFFHWSTALAGGLGCIVVAFIINPVQAAVAFALLAALVWHIKRRELSTTFGDARRGFLYNAVRTNLARLAAMEETPRNWRPTSLVFSGNPESREALVSYAVWLEAGRGIVFLVNILVGSFEEYGPRRDTAIVQLKEFCRKRRIHAFPVVVIDSDLEHAMAGLLQTLCVGPIRPNLALFGWSGQDERVTGSVAQFRTAQAMGMSIVVLHPGQRPFGQSRRRIDVWWRGMKNGGLMVLLAHLLTRNWEWSRARLRLLRQVDDAAARDATRAALERLIHDARIDASAEVVVDTRPFPEVLDEHSSGADCVFLGFEVPEPDGELEWYRRYQPMLCDGPPTILVCSSGNEDILA
ncbi:MAG: amino acid permease [Candidatus Hydrogenedentes bacterium]|nr:amino acid permease [Candidatus Hydrogenedentota bacterium]